MRKLPSTAERHRGVGESRLSRGKKERRKKETRPNREIYLPFHPQPTSRVPPSHHLTILPSHHPTISPSYHLTIP
ncbi:hypothetical protein L228DRAFT_247521 [Xylona heveae TC161]|uniref:Uncharacterized protein n=1 Tax=Xylona heveae (strain CBS 132557 / TC161) TaxID=1328760 RepID=A0A165H734_XYLHT|nr:hypothetical protein L228DRAFT_247521 [Xylona heveae TC161]KZF23075.1 hypothetical protein L228DRAFT_247521 [Xylona heveae TC161]